MSRATLLTPTYGADLERFCFLRESMERCGITMPHVAVIQSEDLHLFEAVSNKTNLTLIPSKDVLPPDLERRRRLWGTRRRNPRRWVAKSPIHGWASQQLLKLAAAEYIETEAIVCIDSDSFFVGYVTEADFLDEDGKVHLYETSSGLDAEMAEWPAHSMRFLGLKPVGRGIYRYTHHPTVFSRSVLQELLVFVNKRTNGRWADAILGADMIMEYTLYGVYAREINGLRGVTPVDPPMTAYFWWPEEVARLEQDFAAKVWDSGARIVGIQSNTSCPISRYRPFAESPGKSSACRERIGCTSGLNERRMTSTDTMLPAPPAERRGLNPDDTCIVYYHGNDWEGVPARQRYLMAAMAHHLPVFYLDQGRDAPGRVTWHTVSSRITVVRGLIRMFQFFDRQRMGWLKTAYAKWVLRSIRRKYPRIIFWVAETGFAPTGSSHTISWSSTPSIPASTRRRRCSTPSRRGSARRWPPPTWSSRPPSRWWKNAAGPTRTSRC